MSIVHAYKAGYSLRITIPKRIFDEFAKIGFANNGHFWPLLALRIDSIDGYDFAFELFTGKREEFFYAGPYIFESGKGNKFFTLPTSQANQLSIHDKTKLQVQVIQTTKPQTNYHNKIIAYKRVSR